MLAFHDHGFRWPRLAVSLAVALLLVAAVLVALGPQPARATASPPRSLVADVLAGLDQLVSGPANPATPMQVGVALSRPDPAGEVALYQRLYQPGSSDYRRFLTPDQFNQRFGVSPQTYQQTVSWLQASGLSVDTSVLSHDYLLATGTLAQVEHTFATTIRKFQTGTTTFLANTTAPSVPLAFPCCRSSASTPTSGSQPRPTPPCRRLRR